MRKQQSTAIVSGDLLERIAFDHGLDVEADDRFKYVTHRGVTLRAVLADTKAAA